MKFKLTATYEYFDPISKYYVDMKERLINAGVTISGNYMADSFIEISSIDELLAFAKKCDEPLIIDYVDNSIEIYNGYRE